MVLFVIFLRMCGRFSLIASPSDLAVHFEASASKVLDAAPSFNRAPTTDVIGIRTSSHGRELVPLRWGLIPHGTLRLDRLRLMINARAESLTDRPSFRSLVSGHRCGILADGFYEWRKEAGSKQPYYVYRRDGAPMAFAGLWDIWKGPRGIVESCVIITTEANPVLAPLHHRMPAILYGDHEAAWLDGGARPMEALSSLPPDLLEAVPVTPRMGRTTFDEPDCTKPTGSAISRVEDWRSRPPAGDSPPDQLALF